MELIYQNFDGLDVTFQGVLPECLLNQLADAKTEAQNSKQDVLLELGPQKLPVMVAESGAGGGYRYRFNTGPDGETWMIASSARLDGWNIRVSVSSMGLALYGYAAMKERIYETLYLLGAEGAGSIGSMLQGRVSRFDYCFDFLTVETFNPDPALIVAHQRCKKQSMGDKEVIAFRHATCGDAVQTLQVGKMPGRQAVLYNKSLEITASSKQYWKELWELDKKPAGTVWRLEVRAGKDELDKWNLKRFADFEAKAGDIVCEILKVIRYVTPTGDSNRGRWPTAPFWQEAGHKAANVLYPYRSNAVREKVFEGLRLDAIRRYKANICGNLLGYIAARQSNLAAFQLICEELTQELARTVKDDPEHYSAKFRQAENRFRFLT